LVFTTDIPLSLPAVSFVFNIKYLAMKQVTPFRINIAQNVLDDLQARLRQTRWTDEPADAGWQYGANPAYMRELADYWQNGYDWRKQEALLNSFPQFKTEIDGVGIHFLHIKGKGANPRPLLLTHGWPDSFYRFYKIIPLLTDPAANGGDANHSFDVIVPSIPGFGFSSHHALPAEQTAHLFAKLMTEILGYSTFFAAGGDMGSTIIKWMSVHYPESIKGIHLTDVGYPNGTEDWSTMSPAEQAFGQFIQGWWYTEGAFNMIQSTKPQTLGYGLNDSPVGLAAWIVEKFNTWSDNNGHIENSFFKDELLTNVMIYWVSQTINSSMRTYLEEARSVYAQGAPKPAQRSSVPAAVASFPGEAPLPKEWAERRVTLEKFTKMSRGGHFAAMEEPKLLADDITAFFYR